jgi:hypothetical protein
MARAHSSEQSLPNSCRNPWPSGIAAQPRAGSLGRLQNGRSVWLSDTGVSEHGADGRPAKRTDGVRLRQAGGGTGGYPRPVPSAQARCRCRSSVATGCSTTFRGNIRKRSQRADRLSAEPRVPMPRSLPGPTGLGENLLRPGAPLSPGLIKQDARLGGWG